MKSRGGNRVSQRRAGPAPSFDCAEGDEGTGIAYILDAVRTPRGRGKKDVGALSAVHPNQLLGQTLQQIQKRLGVDVNEVEDVIIGCVTQVEEQSGVIARNAVLAA